MKVLRSIKHRGQLLYDEKAIYYCPYYNVSIDDILVQIKRFFLRYKISIVNIDYKISAQGITRFIIEFERFPCTMMTILRNSYIVILKNKKVCYLSKPTRKSKFIIKEMIQL